MHEYISISTLNDFIFCPYSIYLHNVYMGGDEDLVNAVPQTQGKIAHTAIDEKIYSTLKDNITGISVFSDELGLVGKIDIYKKKEKKLIERKYLLKTIYQGQIYQLWAQYFCMIEMGYQIESIAFYSISTNTTYSINLPTEKNKTDLINFINTFKHFDPSSPIDTNINKCTHCIYCSLCDKINIENVYS